MPWRPFTTDVVLKAFNADEQSALDAITAAPDDFAEIVNQVCDEFQAAIRARTNDVPGPGLLPNGFIGAACARAIWRYLGKLPLGKALMSDARKAENQAALDLLKEIRDWKVAIEPSGDTPPGPRVRWNSRNKIILRTQPVPPPSSQIIQTPEDQPYANPDIKDP